MRPRPSRRPPARSSIAWSSAYHNAQSYSDVATVHLVAEAGDKKLHDWKANFSLALVRPNKLRIEAYQAHVVCNGQKLFAVLNNLPGQVLVRPAPKYST